MNALCSFNGFFLAIATINVILNTLITEQMCARSYCSRKQHFLLSRQLFELQHNFNESLMLSSYDNNENKKR